MGRVDVISKSPYCLPYNSYEVSFENFLLDQYGIDMVWRNSLLVTRMGVKGLISNRIKYGVWHCIFIDLSIKEQGIQFV